MRWTWRAVCLGVVAVGSGCGQEEPSRTPTAGGPTSGGAKPKTGLPADVEVVLSEDAKARGPGARLTEAWSSGKLAFGDEDLRFAIAREYDQNLSVAVENRTADPASVLAEVGPLEGGLLGSFVGPGGERPLDVAGSSKASLSLRVFAQDADRASATTHVLLRDAKTRDVLATAPLTVFVELPPFQVEATVGDPDPGTLGREVVIENRGKRITDLRVEAGKGLLGKVWFEPRVVHADLHAKGHLAVRVVPLLHPGSSSLEGRIVLRGAGQEREIALRFDLPPGKHVFVGTSASTRSSDGSARYCTNCPDVNFGVGGLFGGASWPEVVRGGILGGGGGGAWGGGGGGPASHPGGSHRGPLDLPDVPDGDPPPDDDSVSPEEQAPPPGTTTPPASGGETGPGSHPLDVAIDVIETSIDWVQKNIEWAGEQFSDADDEVEFWKDTLEISSPRGARVRPTYLAARPHVAEENLSEARWVLGRSATGARVGLAAWHSGRWAPGKNRRILVAGRDLDSHRPFLRHLAIDGGGGFGRWPAATLLEDGRALVVWEWSKSIEGPPALAYRVSEAGWRRWGAVAVIAGTAGAPGSFDPVPVLLRDGRVAIFFQRGEGSGAEIHVAKGDEKHSIGAAQRVEGLARGASRPVARLGRDGSVRLAFTAAEGGTTSVYCARLSDDLVSATASARVSPTGTEAGEPDLLVRGESLHVVFRAGAERASQILHAQSKDGATWSQPVAVSPPALFAEYPSLLPRAGGGLVLSFYGAPRTGEAGALPIRHYRMEGDGASFGEPRRVLTRFPVIEASWLQVRFEAKNDRAEMLPHDLTVLLNGREIHRATGVIPEGTWLFPFHPGLLAHEADGLPRNEIGLRARHLPSGRYQVAMDFRLQGRQAFLEQHVIAETQEEADEIVGRQTETANHRLPDVALLGNDLAPLPARPGPSERITLRLRLANLGEAAAKAIRIDVFDALDAKGRPTGDPVAEGARVDSLGPLDGREVEVSFAFGGKPAYHVFARHDGQDFDPRNDVLSIAFAAAPPPAIAPLSASQEPISLSLSDDRDAPSVVRILGAESGREVARIEKGRLVGTLPPGRYRMAMRRYDFEGQEVTFPRVFEHAPGKKTRVVESTALELWTPAWVGTLHRWEAVRAGKTDEVVQWHHGSHPVMVLPPGEYQIAVQPAQFNSARVIWPDRLRLEQDRHLVARLDSGVAPPSTVLETEPPYQWAVVPDGAESALQFSQDSWRPPILVPPGTYRWAIQPLQFASARVVFEAPLDVRSGRLVRPAPPGVVELIPDERIGVPYGHRLKETATGKDLHRISNSSLVRLLVPAGEYDLFVQPLQFQSEEVPFARVHVEAGGRVSVSLSSGIDVRGSAGDEPPHLVSFTREGDKEPLQRVSGSVWRAHLLPAGTYRVSVQPVPFQSEVLAWPTSVTVHPGRISPFVLDTGIRLVGPEGSSPAFKFQVLDSKTGQSVQRAQGTWAAQWIPPGTYSVRVRAGDFDEWQTVAENVVVKAGRFTEVRLSALPKTK